MDKMAKETPEQELEKLKKELEETKKKNSELEKANKMLQEQCAAYINAIVKQAIKM